MLDLIFVLCYNEKSVLFLNHTPSKRGLVCKSTIFQNAIDAFVSGLGFQIAIDRNFVLWTIVALTALFLPGLAIAEEGAKFNSGDTAWMLTATALVLFMTIPGLSLFYGGLVRRTNVLSVLMQCFALTGLITILWVLVGYSLAFDTTGMNAGTTNLNSFIGGLGKAFLRGVTADSATGAIPETDIPNVPVDVCDYHPGAHSRRLCGAYEVLRSALVFRDMVSGCLRAHLPHGMGG